LSNSTEVTKGRPRSWHGALPRASEIEALFVEWAAAPTDQKLQVLFEKSRPFLFATLISSFPDEVGIVDDALQDAYLKMFVMLRGGPKSHVRSINYLVIIAKNCLVDELRRRRGRVNFDELTQDELMKLSNSESSRIENQIIIVATMTRLDQRTRYVLDSYYLQGRSTKEIALELGVQHDSIYMILKRCRDYFRSIVGGGEKRTEGGEDHAPSQPPTVLQRKCATTSEA
jgi:RNA polymerase sigma factor (sigma-70 family)